MQININVRVGSTKLWGRRGSLEFNFEVRNCYCLKISATLIVSMGPCTKLFPYISKTVSMGPQEAIRIALHHTINMIGFRVALFYDRLTRDEDSCLCSGKEEARTRPRNSKKSTTAFPFVAGVTAYMWAEGQDIEMSTPCLTRKFLMASSFRVSWHLLGPTI